MNQTDVREPLSAGRFASRWAWFPVGLLGLLVSVQAVLFKLSSGDESFAIEPEYYQKAVNWDARAREARASESLGWHTQATMEQAGAVTTLRVTLSDNADQAVSNAVVVVAAFPNARANQVQHLTLKEVEPGVYESALAVTHGGLWELRLSAHTASQTFTKTLRATTPVGAK